MTPTLEPAALPKITVTPSTPLPPSPYSPIRSPPNLLRSMRRIAGTRSLFDVLSDPSLDLPHPHRLSARTSKPRKSTHTRSAAISLIFILSAFLLILSTAVCSTASMGQFHFGGSPGVRLRLGGLLGTEMPIVQSAQVIWHAQHEIDSASVASDAAGPEQTGRAGPSKGMVMSIGAWKAYLNTREAVSPAEPTLAATEVWEFH